MIGSIGRVGVRFCIATLAAGIIAAQAQAQGGLEEVVVTAQKTAENLQTVPIAVSAITGAQFEQTHAFTLEALSATIPNVQIGHFANTPHNAVFNIRGVGAPIEPDPYAGTTVSIVLDGVPQYYNMMALLDLFDVERVEILKGPQGTLFGANTTGGVVNVVTRQPTGEFGGKARASIGNYSRKDVSAALDFPIIEGTLAGKVAATSHTQDGYYKNIITGDSAGDINTTGIRGYLKWTPTDSFDATLMYEWIESKNGSPPIVNGSLPGELLSPQGINLLNPLVEPYQRGVVNGDNVMPMYLSPCRVPGERCHAPNKYRTANNQVPDDSDFESHFTVLTMNWDTSIGQVTSITGYKDFRLAEWTDQDFSPSYGSATYRPTDGWSFSQEVRGDFELSDAFRLQAGGFYMKNSYTHVQSYNMEQFVHGLRQLTWNDGDNWSGSLFAQAYYQLTDKLRAQAGLRYTHEKTKLDVSVHYWVNLQFDDQGNVIGVGDTVWRGDTDTGGIDVNGSDTWDEVGGKFGLDYQINEDVMIYGFYARGFKSGGFVGRITIPQDIGPYDPEYVDSFEVGMKGEFMDRRLRLNLAGFYNKYKDQQISSIYRYVDENGNNLNGNSIVNAAKSDIMGFELELEAAPTDRLRFNASLAYLDTEYKEFDFINPADGLTYDLSGNELQNAPEWGGSAGATYEFPVGPGTLTANLQYRYQDGKFYTSPLNSRRSYIQPTHFVDANIDWTPDSGSWTVSLWARNLMDKRYVSVSYDSPGYAALVGYYPPREYGVTFDYNW